MSGWVWAVGCLLLGIVIGATATVAWLWDVLRLDDEPRRYRAPGE